jgi:hypothetical protein
MHRESATPNLNAGAASRRRSRRVFARHFGEMVLAMLLGMAVLGGLAELAFAAAGSSVNDTAAELRVLLMGFNMTLPMVAWMSYRGHASDRNVEMAASMILPTLLVAVLAWTGVLGAAGALGLQHGVMIPAMLAVILWRYEDYSQARP